MTWDVKIKDVRAMGQSVAVDIDILQDGASVHAETIQVDAAIGPEGVQAEVLRIAEARKRGLLGAQECAKLAGQTLKLDAADALA